MTTFLTELNITLAFTFIPLFKSPGSEMVIVTSKLIFPFSPGLPSTPTFVTSPENVVSEMLSVVIVTL